jgi:ATP-dependent DNA helicase UvrD/PcrA
MLAKATFTPTDEQQAIVAAAKSSSDSLMIVADAGCAKSSTLRLLGTVIREPVLGMAFNKSTAKEMADSMPGNFSWKTANGLGHGAWIRANSQVTSWNLDDRKLGKLVSQTAKEQKIDLSSDQWDSVRQLVSAAMLAGITPDNIGKPLRSDSDENWKGLADDCWISDDDFPMLQMLAKMVLIESINLARRGTISFDDQIYCSVCLGGRFAQFPVVMVDETQDLNELNHQMVSASLRPDGRIICVGDPKQSIYAFRGAHTESMEKVRALRQRWQNLSLHVTFRCPKVIVARQQSHAPGFKAWHTNPEGKFWQLPADTEASGGMYEDEIKWDWYKLGTCLPATTASLAILCRNNAPLMSMAFKLIRRRVGVKMLGRQLGKQLVSFSKKIIPKDETPAVQCAALLTDWLDHEVALARANDKSDSEIESLQDRVECLRAVLSDAEVRDAGSLRTVVNQLFAKEDGLVTLGSGHRSKGLEWDAVCHLDPWRLPSKQARAAQASGNAKPMQQEMNLNYVIETRTRHTLINANLEDFR